MTLFNQRAVSSLLITFSIFFIAGMAVIFANDKNMIKDPLGHQLLEERINECGPTVAKMLEKSSISRMPHVFKNFIVTGIGSSQAHARYFENLINQYTPAKARYVPLSHFLEENLNFNKDDVLVVFSQGLSPNAQLALKQEKDFEHVVLFTAEEVQPSPKQTIVRIPVKKENLLLIRVLGPMAVYLAVIQFIDEHWPKSVPPVSQEKLLSAINQAKLQCEKIIINDRHLKDLESGPILLTNTPISDYGQNLAFKFLEGAFFPMPGMFDYLDFSHGPFQQLISNPRLLILLRNRNVIDDYLYEKSQPLLKASKTSVWEISSSLPIPWSILEFEAVLNHLILKIIKKLEINQREWPGKGKDTCLYYMNESIK